MKTYAIAGATGVIGLVVGFFIGGKVVANQVEGLMFDHLISSIPEDQITVIPSRK